MGNRRLFHSVGYTEGYGHFHIPEELFAAFVAFLNRTGDLPGSTFGRGPNYRMRVTRKALTALDLNPELLRHGIRREVFLAPVAHNWREILRGEEIEVDEIDLPLADLAQFYVSRWAFPRAVRDPSYKGVTAAQTLALIRPGVAYAQPLIDAGNLRFERANSATLADIAIS